MVSYMTGGGGGGVVEKGLGKQQDRILENSKGTQIPLTSLWTPSKYIKNFYKSITKRQRNPNVCAGRNPNDQ